MQLFWERNCLKVLHVDWVLVHFAAMWTLRSCWDHGSIPNWSRGRHYFLHCPFKTSIKPSLSPTIQRDREAEHVFVRISGGGLKGDKASWNRKCWLGRVPASGNVFSHRGSLKRPQRGFTSKVKQWHISPIQSPISRRGGVFIKFTRKKTYKVRHKFCSETFA